MRTKPRCLAPMYIFNHQLIGIFRLWSSDKEIQLHLWGPLWDLWSSLLCSPWIQTDASLDAVFNFKQVKSMYNMYFLCLGQAEGLPWVLSRPSEFKLVAGGDNRQICFSYGLAPLSFWLTSPRLWNQAFSLSCPLFSELHPALAIPGHSLVHNASLKGDLTEIL